MKLYEAQSITFSEKRIVLDPPIPNVSNPKGVVMGTYDASVEAVVTLAHWDEVMAVFAAAMPRREVMAPSLIATGKRGAPSCASLVTLVKRYRYGGRKGRRAKARMITGAWGPTPVAIDQSRSGAFKTW
jgi:hypothetical protein